MIKLKKALNDTWFFFRSNIYRISLIVLPIAIPVEIVSVIMEWYIDDERTFTSSDWIPVVVEILLYPIYQGALIFYLASSLSGEKITIKQCYRQAFYYWDRLFFLYVIVGITFSIGFLLLIIPGLIVLSRVAFSEFYCLFENRTAIESFSKSWNTTKEEQWLLLEGIVGIYLITVIPFIVLSYTVDALELWNPLLSIVTGCAYTVLLTLITVFYFRVFTSDPQRLNQLNKRDAESGAPS